MTSGDRFQGQPLQDLGGKGLFIKELEEALLDGRADFAVHSMKDVPFELAPGLTLSAVPKREDPRDALITRDAQKLSELPPNPRLGTSSLRRSVSLKELRPDAQIGPLRGNVDTRIRKVEDKEVDGTVLALAGLRRLGLAERATEVFDPELFIPAVGQGALGIEIRASRTDVAELLSVLDDSETSLCVAAERALMARVEGNCRKPIAAHASRAGSEMRLAAMLADEDGSRARRTVQSIAWPRDTEASVALGQRVAEELLARRA